MGSRGRASKNRIRVLLGALGTILVLVLVAVFSDVQIEEDSLMGTMAGAPALVVENSAMEWRETTLDGMAGTMSDVFEASLTFRSREDRGAVGFDLFLSRDLDFDAGDDCLVQGLDVPVAAGVATPVQFRSRAFEANCVDAGTWYAAVRVSDTGQWIPIGKNLVIAGGEADLELARLAPEIGWHEPLSMSLDVHRVAGDAGLAGLLAHPATVWLKRDDRLCVVSAEAITLPRDPDRRIHGSWVASRVELVVDPAGAFRVDSDLGLSDLVARPSSQVPLDGSCRVDEGEWQVAVGPVSPTLFKTASVYVHARPSRVESAPVKLTLPSGEVTSTAVAAVNPSKRAVNWSATADHVGAEGWLKGMSGQRLEGGESTDLLLTISAVDLQPGFYAGAFRITLDDYYRTEVLVPVELTVQTKRTDGWADGQDLPGEFEISNYPNPFRDRTTIRVQLLEPGPVRLVVYDVSGREVRLVADEWMSDGVHEIPFDAGDLPSGTYLGRITTESGALSRTMTLVN